LDMGDTALYTKRLIKKYSFSPKKSLGQIFLISDGPIERMVEAISPREGDLVIEIGPGLGALTRHLAAASEVVAFEIDERLCDILNAQLPGATILHRDFLEVDLGLFVDAYLSSAKRPVKICGNLPYNAATQILIRIATTDTPYVHAHFLIQKELGAKISSGPGEGDYGRISAMVQTFCTVDRLFDVRAGAFYPAPKVDSTYLRLEHRPDHIVYHEDIPSYGALVKGAFSQRRKSLFNNLRKYLGLKSKKEQDALLDVIEIIGGTRNTRSEEINADRLAELYYRLLAQVIPEEGDLP
jgi:16S rRNA (adenine1518-N6/adenine1519-N6)-dimethyltransferase